MLNQPKHNPKKDGRSHTTIPNASTPNGRDGQQGKIANPIWSRDPETAHSTKSAKSASPSLPWTEPEIDEVSPFGPGGDQASD